MKQCEICCTKYACRTVGAVHVCSDCYNELHDHMERMAMFNKMRGSCLDFEDIVTVAGSYHRLLDLLRCTCELCDVDYQQFKEKLYLMYEEME